MFPLFLLSAVAGVNAILGGEVRGIRINDKEFICANNYAYRNIYLTQLGRFCPKEEVIVVEDGNFNADGVEFDCKRTHQTVHVKNEENFRQNNLINFLYKKKEKIYSKFKTCLIMWPQDKPGLSCQLYSP